MLHLTKREIYQAFADWYGLGGNAAEVMQASDRLTHFKDMVITAANRERLEKAQVIWEIAQCAPELWSRDNKIDVGLIVGYDCDFSMELFPALSKDIQKQFSRDSTAMFLERKYLPLAPIAWYLNACSPLMSSFGVGQLGSVAYDSSAVVYDRVCSKLEAAVTYGLRNINVVEAQKDTAACYETMKRMIRAFKVSYCSLAEASLEYQASVNRNGFTVTWLYWNFIRNRWTAQDARDSLRRVDFTQTRVPSPPEGVNANAKILDNADGFFNKVPTRKRPVIGAGGIVQGFEPFFDESTPLPEMMSTGEITKGKHDLRFTVRDSAGEGGVNEVGYVDGSLKIDEAPFGYDAVDNEAALNGTAATYEMPAEHPYTGAVPILRGEHTLPAGVPVSYEPTTRVEKELSDENNWTPAAPLPDISAMKLRGATLMDVFSVLLQSEDIYGSLADAISDANISRWHVKTVMMATAMWLGDSMRFVESDEGDPLRDPVAAWLAETLRPRTINWTTNDPISDTLNAVVESNTAWTHKDLIQGAVGVAGFLVAAHDSNKGVRNFTSRFAKHEARGVPSWGDFQTRLAKLADGDVDTLFRYVHDVFGERVKLKVLTIAPALCHMTYQIGDARYAILWASTGKHVISGIGDNKYDVLSADNIRHLRACYNAHINKADTEPCSHSTSQKS